MSFLEQWCILIKPVMYSIVSKKYNRLILMNALGFYDALFALIGFEKKLNTAARSSCIENENKNT